MNKQPIPLNFFFFSSLVFLLLWVSHAHAALPETFPLSRYEAQYNIEWHGLKAGTSTHRLDTHSNDTYIVESKTLPRFKWIPIHFVEESKFIWDKRDIKPLRYFYDLKEARKHKKGMVEFDWDSKQVINKVGAEPYQKELTLGIQDKLTHALKLRIELLSSSTPKLKYIVAEDDEVKPYVFHIIAHERLQTAIGWLDTIKISHTSRSGKQFTMWLAKNLEYAPVQVEQSKDGSVFARGEIISYRKL